MSHDGLDGLSEYLGVFSDTGSLPTSLQGYGYHSSRHLAAVGLGAQQQTDDPAGPKPSVSDKKSPAYGIGTARYQQLVSRLVKDIRWGLTQLGIKAGTDKAWDDNLRLAWARYIGGYKRLDNGLSYTNDFYPAAGGFDSKNWLWVNSVAVNDLGARAKAASTKGGTASSSSPAANTSQKVTAPAPQPTAGNFVTSVASVQDILVRLGWKSKGKTTGPLSKDMTDGLFGGTTVTNWQQSASKRKLDTTIQRDSGTTVLVNQATFLGLKQVADQMVPPTVNQPVVPAPSGTTTITEAQLNEVLGRMAGAPLGAVQPYDRLVADYQARAKAGGLDTSISKDQKGGIVVSQKTWDAFMAAFNTLPAQKAAPTPAPTPAKKNLIDQAKEEIAKASTTSLSTKDLTNFFNIAISQGVGALKGHAPFKNTTWIAEYVGLVTQLLQVTGDAKTAWEQMLVTGKLVSKDLKTVKLPADQVAAIKRDIANYNAQKKEATTAPKDFTKVDTSKVIGWVNDLHLVSTQFKTNGGATEMANALRTFIDQTKTAAPSTIVWGDDKTGVYVQNGVLSALNKATDANKSNSAKTQQFRDKIVSDAIKASTDDVGMQPLQLSFIETVSSKKAGKDEKIYAKVKQTDSFDSATRDAYTALARAMIIGPAFDQYQKMLKEQMGSSFTSKFAEQEYNKIWAEYLKQALGERTGTYAQRYDNSKVYIRTLPVLAKQIRAAAKARIDREGSQKVAADETSQAKKDLAAAVAKSTSILAVIDAQLGLLWAIEKKSTKFAKGIKATGVADAALGIGMKDFSKAVFDRDIIPDKLWAEYLEATGIKATTTNNVTFGWPGANFIAVPAATATTLSKAATSWMAKHGVPDGYKGMTSLNPINQATLARFTKATVVRAEAPKKAKTDDDVITDFDKKKAADNKKKKLSEQKKLEAEAKRLKDQIAKDKAAKKAADAKAKKLRDAAKAAAKAAAQDALNKEAQAAAAKADAEAKAAEAEAARQAALLAQNQQKAADVASQQQAAGGAGGASQGGQGGDVNVTINTPPAPAPDSGIPSFQPAPPAPLPDLPPAPAPAPEPPPAPAPVVEAGMGSSWLLMSAVGLGVLFYSKKGSKTGMRDKRQQTRYPKKRGGRK